MRPAILLDKDGTLIDDVPFNVDPDRVRLARGAADGLSRLAGAGYALAMVSNQSGVALGRFPAEALDGVTRRIAELLAPTGVVIEGWHFCLHAPDAGCACRKPRPGLLLEAARRHGLDLSRSWMVGDILDDIEAGHRAGCRGAVLVDNGNETVWHLGEARVPDHRAPDLARAADWILAQRQATPARLALGQAS